MTSLFLGYHEYDESCHIYIKKEANLSLTSLSQQNKWES